MAEVISNCCEADVMLSVGLVQFVLSSKVTKSDLCPKMTVLK